MQKIKDELKKLELVGQLRKIPNIEVKTDGKIVIDGKEYINYASNDYLGISTKTQLVKEFINSYNDNFPLFSSASARLLSGSSSEFKELEQTLAKLFNKESALIFNTGYQCNLGVISALIGKNDVVFSDKLNHASIIDGMRLAEGTFIRYKHFDYEQLEKILQSKRNQFDRAIIVSESVFSMDGDIVDIDKLIELKNKYNCLLMIDEAHAFCAWGNDLTGLTYNKNVDIVTATFGKSVGSFGAFCVSNKDIINYLINKSRSFIFSTSIPPINIAWTNWLLTEKKDYLKAQKNRLTSVANSVHEILHTKGSHIIPIVIGSNEDTINISEKLKSLGYYIPAIRPPTVPEGTSRLRISLTAESDIKEFKKILDVINR
jgi:8-amino-7-oxononanoate synthase